MGRKSELGARQRWRTDMHIVACLLGRTRPVGLRAPGPLAHGDTPAYVCVCMSASSRASRQLMLMTSALGRIPRISLTSTCPGPIS